MFFEIFRKVTSKKTVKQKVVLVTVQACEQCTGHNLRSQYIYIYIYIYIYQLFSLKINSCSQVRMILRSFIGQTRESILIYCRHNKWLCKIIFKPKHISGVFCMLKLIDLAIYQNYLHTNFFMKPQQAGKLDPNVVVGIQYMIPFHGGKMLALLLPLLYCCFIIVVCLFVL